MKTLSNKTQKQAKKPLNTDQQSDLAPFHTEGTFMNVPLEKISISPLNCRKLYNQADLESFAAELAVHHIIHPLTLRKSTADKYELVVGERRFRAAGLAALKIVPAIVKELTDEQVIEIMLAENLQRENPHPLHEAQGIELMYKAGKSIEYISGRLGKSKPFIYSRLKWAELILPLQEMFLADKLPVQGVSELSILSADAQQEFFDQHCKNWQKGNFRFIDVKYAVSRFMYELSNAPFDTQDKALIPEAGACSGCPFNSATLKSLFPEMAKKAVCSNKACYKNKCDSHFKNMLLAAIAEHQPDALLSYGTLSEDSKAVINSLPEASGLVHHSVYEVNTYTLPVPPDRQDYLDSDEDSGEEIFDEAGFNLEQQDYEAELADYQNKISSGKLLKGVQVTNDRVKLVYFDTEKRTFRKESTLTAKEVQQAIKDRTATVEMLSGEIQRIEDRKTRSLELDRIKVQQQVFDTLTAQLEQAETLSYTLTEADKVAARLLVYDALDYHARNTVSALLFEDTDGSESLYQAIANLTDAQYAYLIRMTLTSQPESKSPSNLTGISLYKVAEEAGLDVAAIEKLQAEKAAKRKANADARIAELQVKSNALSTAA